MSSLRFPRNFDLKEVGCGWLGSPYAGRGLWRSACHFKARHLIGGVPICNTHYRVMRRYVEAHEK